MVHASCHPLERVPSLDVLQGLVLLGLLIDQAFGQLASPQPIHPLPLHDLGGIIRIVQQFIVRALC